MLDLLFVLCFISFPVVFYAQLRAAGLRLFEVSILSITFISLLLFSYVGCLPLYFFWDEYRYETGVQDKITILLVFVLSSVNIFCFLMGAIFYKMIFRKSSVFICSDNVRPVSSKEVFGVVILIALCLSVLALYVSNVGSIAMLVALQEGAREAAVARSLMGNDFSGKYHWFRLVMHDMGNFVSYALFSAWLVGRAKFLLFLFFVSFVYSTFVAVMATEKAPLAFYVIGLFMTYVVTKKNAIIPISGLVSLAVAVISFLIVLHVYFAGAADPLSALQSVFSRAFTGGITPAYFYLEFFPEHQDYLLGKTFPNPGGIFPFEPYPYTVEVMNWVHPEHIALGVVGTAPTVFWGEAYANFGLFGVPVIALLVGVAFSAISYEFNRLELTPIWVGFYIWMILYFRAISVTGFSGYVINFYLFAMGLLYVVFLVIVNSKIKLRAFS